MLKTKKNPPQKGRWLVVEQTKQTNEAILSLVRVIEGAEIRIRGKKTYVRFPEYKKKKSKPLIRYSKRFAPKQFNTYVSGAEKEQPRLYCAIMLKD